MPTGISKYPRDIWHVLAQTTLVQTYNIKEIYAENYDLWPGILAVAGLTIFSTSNRLKVYSPSQILFGRDMILPIKHTVDWEFICQQN